MLNDAIYKKFKIKMENPTEVISLENKLHDMLGIQTSQVEEVKEPETETNEPNGETKLYTEFSLWFCYYSLKG